MEKTPMLLKEIPIDSLKKDVELYYRLFDNISYDLFDRLLKLENYEELKKMLEDGIVDTTSLDGYLNIRNRLKEVETNLNKYNFSIQNVQNELLSKIDDSVSGSELLYASPFTYSARRAKLKSYSILKLKQKFDESNEIPFHIMTFGPLELEKLKKSIQFYDEQIARLLEAYGYKENLFYIDKERKDELVKNQVKEVIEYLTDTAQEYVWGNLTDANKQRLSQLIYGKYNGNRDQDLGIFVNNISNYVVLDEAEKGLVKTKALNRFIVR